MTATLARAPGTARVEVVETSAGPIRLHLPAPPVGHSARPSRGLLVLHGMDRAAARYARQWGPLARSGQQIAAPEFERARFPDWRAYNLAGMWDRRDRARPPERWLFGAIEELRQWMARGYDLDRVDLFGHSAGGQLVARHALFAPPSALPGAMIAANAGWYTLPDQTVPFPYGLGAAPARPELGRVLARPLTLLVGDRDTDRSHHGLRRDAGAIAQGATRLDRAHHCFTRAAGMAARLDTPLGWRLCVVPGAGHSNGQITAAARRLLDA
ncbi:MAG: hypothetical protein AAGE18_00715 [Pseudomonadota bacterium]